jgi:hypothetical protein
VGGAGDLNGDGFVDVVVGAQAVAGPTQFEGGAFVFLGSANGISNATSVQSPMRFELDQANTNTIAVAAAADLNGDGYSDLVFGSDAYDGLDINEGSAFVVFGAENFGAADGITSVGAGSALRLRANQADAGFGSSVAAGDFDGDGYADVVVGASEYDTSSGPNSDEGAVFVFRGSPSGIEGTDPASAQARLHATTFGASGARFGKSVSSAGDVNGDGYADVIVGAPTYWVVGGGNAKYGAAFVFTGSPAGVADGTTETAHARYVSEAAMGTFEFRIASVASAGDVNGDGVADVVLGAPAYQQGPNATGAALVYLGQPGGRAVAPRQFGAGYAPVQPGSSSGTYDGFIAEMRAHHPAGRGSVRLEVEACPQGVRFDDDDCVTNVPAGWDQAGPLWPELVTGHNVYSLDPGMLYRWRARVQYADLSGARPLAPAHGPWRRLNGQAVEGDIRTLPEPGLVARLASGCVVLAALACRRRRPR